MISTTDNAGEVAETTRADLKSWVESANTEDTDFPIQNLPFGVFSDARSNVARVGVAIGDWIVDLAALESARLIAVPYTVVDDDGNPKSVFRQQRLSDFVALGRPVWRSVRSQLSALLSTDTATLRDDHDVRERAMVRQSDAVMHLPFEIPGYTDFYSSREHATNVVACSVTPKTL